MNLRKHFFILPLLWSIPLVSQELTPQTSFLFIDNRPFVEVSVNGVSGHFILDTGGRLGFNEAFALEAGIEKVDSLVIGGAGNGNQQAWFSSRQTISITNTDIISAGESPLILNLNVIRDSLNLPFLDGVIGLELFQQFDVGIDYVNHQISFYEAGNHSGDGFEKVPFVFFRNQIPMVELFVEGQKGQFTIDTGDRSYLTIFPEFYQSHAFKGSLEPLSITGYGVGRPIMAREFNLSRAQMGSTLIQEQVKTRVPEHDAGSWANNSHAGNIGSGLLKNYEVIFDYQHQTISIRKINKT